MSVQKRGDVWVVRWRDETGRPQKTFDRKADADYYDAEVKRRKRLGTLAELDAGSETLDEYVGNTWAKSHTAHLSARTIVYYTDLYDGHISPTLGGTPLRAITPEMIGKWQTTLVRSGVRRPTVQKARTLLGAILQRAHESRRIPANPQ